jgi:hypothetical protein
MGIGHWEKDLGTRRKTCFKFSPLVPPASPASPASPAPSFSYLTELLLLLFGLGKAVEFLTFLSPIKMS